MRAINLLGMVFKDLTVTEYIGCGNHGAKWLCLCRCGKEKQVTSTNLRNGKTTSCGCRSIPINTRHGMTGSKVHKIWTQMKYRCLTPTSHAYDRYGGAGIFVCDRWLIFENFFEDMGYPPSKKHSIDRIDGTKGYSKENCRWATSMQQSANLKTNKKITLNGIVYNEREFARVIGISRSTLRSRLRRGWSIERISNVPVGNYSKLDK